MHGKSIRAEQTVSVVVRQEAAGLESSWPLSTVTEPRGWEMIQAKVGTGGSCRIMLGFRDYSDAA